MYLLPSTAGSFPPSYVETRPFQRHDSGITGLQFFCALSSSLACKGEHGPDAVFTECHLINLTRLREKNIHVRMFKYRFTVDCYARMS